MALDYIYSEQSEQFAFYRIPKVLFTNDKYREISAEAKILYGLLLDRVSLSTKNGWVDDQNRVYVYYTNTDVMQALNCGEQKATGIFKELEQTAGLIERKRQGLGRPCRIYVKNFTTAKAPRKSGVKTHENHGSVPSEIMVPDPMKITGQDPRKSRCSYTDTSNTEMNNTDSSSSSFRKRDDEDDLWKRCRLYFMRQWNYPELQKQYPLYQDILEEILDIVVETVCVKEKGFLIRNTLLPASVVRDKFLKLTADHIILVLDAMKSANANVSCMRSYLRAVIYDKACTAGCSYQVMVNHDLANESNQEVSPCQNPPLWPL